MPRKLTGMATPIARICAGTLCMTPSSSASSPRLTPSATVEHHGEARPLGGEARALTAERHPPVRQVVVAHGDTEGDRRGNERRDVGEGYLADVDGHVDDGSHGADRAEGEELEPALPRPPGLDQRRQAQRHGQPGGEDAARLDAPRPGALAGDPMTAGGDSPQLAGRYGRFFHGTRLLGGSRPGLVLGGRRVRPFAWPVAPTAGQVVSRPRRTPRGKYPVFASSRFFEPGRPNRSRKLSPGSRDSPATISPRLYEKPRGSVT